eukprot:1595407-Prymnesium_polylepis.1
MRVRHCALPHSLGQHRLRPVCGSARRAGLHRRKPGHGEPAALPRALQGREAFGRSLPEEPPP